MKYSLGISNFLEEISSLSHSIVFLYFFALITKEVFLISPFYSLQLCIQFLFSFAFLSILFFSQLFVRPPQTTSFCFCISFSWGDGLDHCLFISTSPLISLWPTMAPSPLVMDACLDRSRLIIRMSGSARERRGREGCVLN